jgi:hypothetical protein
LIVVVQPLPGASSLIRFLANLRAAVYDEREAAVIDWAIRAATERIGAHGRVSYDHGEYLPSERCFLAWFDADDASLIQQVAETAQLVGVVVSEVIALDEGPGAADSSVRAG